VDQVVRGVVTLSGISLGQFGSVAQASFKTEIATNAGVVCGTADKLTACAATDVTLTVARRDVSVTFFLLVADAETANAAAVTVTLYVNSTAFVTALQAPFCDFCYVILKVFVAKCEEDAALLLSKSALLLSKLTWQAAAVHVTGVTLASPAATVLAAAATPVPTRAPTANPTHQPTTTAPTSAPTASPTHQPTNPTPAPTTGPTNYTFTMTVSTATYSDSPNGITCRISGSSGAI